MNEELNQGITIESLTWIVGRLLRKWYLILVSASLCLILGLAYGYYSYKPMYSLQSILAIGGKDSEDADSRSGLINALQYKALALSYQEVVSSQQLKDALINSLPFEISPSELDRAMNVSLKEESSIITFTFNWQDEQELRQLQETCKYITNLFIGKVWGLHHSWVDEYSKPHDIAGLPQVTRAKFYAIIGALAGVAVSLLVLCIQIFVGKSVSDPKTIREKVKLPILAALPQRRKFQRINLRDRKYFEYRINLLIAKLANESSVDEKKPQSILIFGATSHCGSAGVTSELSMGFSKTRAKTLYIDMTMNSEWIVDNLDYKDERQRRDYYDVFLQTKKKAVHYTEELTNINKNYCRTVRSAVSENGKYDCIYFSQAVKKQTPPNKIEFLSNFLEETKKQYDIIVLRVSPVMEEEEWILMGKFVDKFILLLHTKNSNTDHIKFVKSKAEQENIKIDGCIINAVKKNYIEKLY